MADFLRILHITDLHFTADGPEIDQPSHQWLPDWQKQVGQQDANLLGWLRSQTERLAETSSERTRFVLITGDTVERGKKEEFTRAVAFLKDLANAVGVPRDRVLIVPGNHDVDWSADPSRAGARFDNFVEAYGEDFTIPEFDGKRFRPKWVPLGGVIEGVVGEIALLSSPTFSGVPDATLSSDRFIARIEDLVGRVAVDMREALQQAIEGGRTILDIGAVGDWQLQRLARPSSGDGVRIAALHHHLLPDPQVEVTPFDAVIDAGQTLQLLVDLNFNLVVGGHKHNRRLAQYGYDRSMAIDVYTGPALFRATSASLPGFTFLDVNPPSNVNYAELSYIEWRGSTTYAESSKVELARSGHVDTRIVRIASEVRAADQGERLVPAMEAMKGAFEWRSGHVAQQLFDNVWTEVHGGLLELQKRRLIFRADGLPQRWRELIDLAAQQEGSDLQLVSLNDLKFWESAYKKPNSEAARYSSPVRAFPGPKSRILVLDSKAWTDPETRERASFVVTQMVADGILVRIVERSSTDKMDIAFRRVSLDFANIGDLAVSRFRAMTDTESQTTIIRELLVDFSERALTYARADWDRLLTCVVWESVPKAPSISTFLSTPTQ